MQKRRGGSRKSITDNKDMSIKTECSFVFTNTRFFKGRLVDQSIGHLYVNNNGERSDGVEIMYSFTGETGEYEVFYKEAMPRKDCIYSVDSAPRTYKCHPKLKLTDESLRNFRILLHTRIDKRCMRKFESRIRAKSQSFVSTNEKVAIICAFGNDCCTHPLDGESPAGYILVAGEYVTVDGLRAEINMGSIDYVEGKVRMVTQASEIIGKSLCGRHGIQDSREAGVYPTDEVQWRPSLHYDIVNLMLIRSGYNEEAILETDEIKLSVELTAEEKDERDKKDEEDERRENKSNNKKTIIISTVSAGAAIVAAVAAFAYCFSKKK